MKFLTGLTMIIIPMILLILTFIISKETSLQRMKISPFECGFEAFSSARISFSLKFYLIVIIFLVFDAEIALMLPLPISIISSSMYTWLMSMTVLTIILILGLLIEWQQGAMSWSNYKNFLICYLLFMF